MTKRRPPQDPNECQHRRWSDVIDMRTGQPRGRQACWYCGIPKPVVPEAAP